MRQEVWDEIDRLVDAHYPDMPLNRMVKSFVEEKRREGSKWAEITTTAHFMFGGSSQQIVHSAAAAEFLLLALDIVDDLQDQDNPDKPWMACPQSYALNAVLSCFVLFMSELGLVLDRHSVYGARLFKEMGALLSGAIYGQQMDISNAVVTEQDYIDAIQRKSGLLMRLACFLGYALADPGADERQAAAMNEAATYIGIMSQLENDLRDIARMDGKNDLLHKRKTLPILFLLRGSEAEFPLLSRYYEGSVGREQFVARKEDIFHYISDSGCVEYTRAIQNLYKERADALLDSIRTDGSWKRKFRELTYGRSE